MTKKSTKKEFIKKAKLIHGDKYDYSKVEYINNKSKVLIICPIHGEFFQRPNDHLSGYGCLDCAGKRKLTTDDFIFKAKQVHNDRYNYSKTEYVNYKSKVCIICPEHGEFWQIPYHHLNGTGCPKCSHQSYCHTNKSFTDKAKQIHGNKYDYSKVNYINNSTKVCIICQKHGEFWQTPNDHLDGCGCPKCKQSKLENEIELELLKNNIKFEYRNHPKWLEGLELDFYIKDKNIAIECQGTQHYEPRDGFGGEPEFEKVLERDVRKAELCKENGVKLLYFTHYPKINEEGDIYKNKDKLLEEILR